MKSKDLAASLSKLDISSSKPKAKKKEPVADSWEDEDLSGSDTETESDPKRGYPTSAESDQGTSAPPPTPASPTIGGAYPENLPYNPYQSVQPSRERQNTPDKRPEKTTSVAARLIAGGLGVRVPKRTEEQREFDKAVREKEKKRRDEEREKAKGEEVAKQNVWED